MATSRRSTEQSFRTHAPLRKTRHGIEEDQHPHRNGNGVTLSAAINCPDGFDAGKYQYVVEDANHMPMYDREACITEAIGQLAPFFRSKRTSGQVDICL